jgi:two-component system response regulator PilR (NtrC family)
MTQPIRILVVDDERSMRDMVSILLKRNGFEVVTARSGSQAISLFDQGERFDVIVTDLVMDRGGGIDVLKAVKERALQTEVIVFTAFGSPETAVEAMKLGAFDYLSKPFNVDEFLIIVHHAVEHRELIRENIDLRARVKGEYRYADIIGRSEAIRDTVALCQKVADSPATVLVSGESGTGKELVARAIHFSGPRAENPFIPVNCGALPEHLMESELFGHVKGAFTGAYDNKDGLFMAADKGTVFLDEIGELPLSLQVKLLRVLQDKQVRPVGASQEVPVDVRVVAASNRDLAEQVKVGAFRADLFYRLNVISIRIPPLRERQEDIPLLAEHLLEKLSFEYGLPAKKISREAMLRLLQYRFPGNVRELANILERASTLAATDQIEPGDLPPEVASAVRDEDSLLTLPDEGVALDTVLESLERSLLNQALARTGGARTKAAELLGISFRSLRYRLSKHGISPEED